MSHMMMVMISHMMARPSAEHGTEVMSHSHAPAAEAAVRIDPGAIIPVIRAGEQPSDKRQHDKKYDETEHCYSPFAGDPALFSP